jgi:8-oxo-dGTP diphosphatase
MVGAVARIVTHGDARVKCGWRVMLIVVAALIESNGKLLVCQRRRGSSFELMWEFPGGKKGPDETLDDALARELIEELGVTAKIGPEVHRTQHRYAEMSEPIEIVFFAASAAPEDMRNIVFERIEWREPKTLPELNFLPADRELIEKLAAGEIQLRRAD